MDARYIVAELSRNYAEHEPPPLPPLGVLFEAALSANEKRGYRLHTWRMTQTVVKPGTLTATIVAVFERYPPVPS